MIFTERRILYDSQSRKKNLAPSVIISTEFVARKLPSVSSAEANLDCQMFGVDSKMETAVTPWLIRQDMDFY
jgi:uncharacterized protein YlaN (UPF0358 family)